MMTNEERDLADKWAAEATGLSGAVALEYINARIQEARLPRSCHVNVRAEFWSKRFKLIRNNEVTRETNN